MIPPVEYTVNGIIGAVVPEVADFRLSSETVLISCNINPLRGPQRQKKRTGGGGPFSSPFTSILALPYCAGFAPPALRSRIWSFPSVG